MKNLDNEKLKANTKYIIEITKIYTELTKAYREFLSDAMIAFLEKNPLATIQEQKDNLKSIHQEMMKCFSEKTRG
ncbi:MAG: DUF1216 domain-containing protein [Candidatus Heimdallarchaeota archaeon]